MPQVANILTRALQTESLSADTDRLINDVLFGEGGVVDVVGDSFEVTQDTGANMQITVGSGAAGDKAVVVRDGRAYLLEHQDASIDLAISAADADDDRIDLVIVRVYDDEADSSGNTYGDIEVVEGTPAASPTVPATPDGAIALASVLVAEDVTAITDSDITDLRAEAVLRDEVMTPAINAFTPTLEGSTSNPTLGTGSDVSGQYSVVGGWCHGWVRWRFGASGVAAGSGVYQFTPPVDLHASVVGSGTTGEGTVVGHGWLRDDSAVADSVGVVLVAFDANTIRFVPVDNNAFVSDSTPAVKAANDRITVHFSFPVAA